MEVSFFQAVFKQCITNADIEILPYCHLLPLSTYNPPQLPAAARSLQTQAEGGLLGHLTQTTVNPAKVTSVSKENEAY